MLSSPYNYIELTRDTNEQTGLRHYNTPDKEFLPSVTTILSKTADPNDTAGLKAWQDWIGLDRANKIRDEAGAVGTLMHQRLEWYVQDIVKKVGSNMIHQQASKMATVIVEKGLSQMESFWGTEICLWYPGLYAGSTDLAGIWNGKEAIIDYKQANKLKKPEQIINYKNQLCAYALAHNELYGTNIKTGVILICTRALEYQEFIVEGAEFEEYTDKWFDRVEAYYKL